MRFFISLFILFSATAFAINCTSVKVLSADTLKNAQVIYAKIKQQSASDAKLKEDLAPTDFFVNGTPRVNGFYFYQVDINNDHHKEYVFTYVGEGSLGAIEIVTFSKENGKFIYLGAPTKPDNAGDGPWYFSWYSAPQTHQQEFLVKGCGNIYMQFAIAPNNTLTRYLWGNGKTTQII